MENKIYITGDTHAPIDIQKLSALAFPQGEALIRDDMLIICGDCGLVWNNSPEELACRDWINSRPYTTLFVDGNHENFTLLNKFQIYEWNGGKVHFISDNIIHLMRGQVYLFNGVKFFTMGGASSIDKMNRKKGISWWPEEMPSKIDYNEAIENLEKHDFSVDYIITHAAPDSIMSRFYPKHDDELELNRFLEYIKNNVRYKHWYFGHLHFDINIDNKHTVLYDKITLLPSFSFYENY